MKKTLLSIMLLTTTIFTLTGCSLSKEKSTISDFETATTGANLIELEVDTSTMDDAYEDLSVYCDVDMTYQVEFYDMASDANAQALFNSFNENIELSYGDNISMRGNVSMGNYATNYYGYDDAYFYVAKVDDTVFFGFTETAGKEPIKVIAETIGY